MHQTISLLLTGVLMFLVTVGIQYFLFKKKKNVRFWSGPELVFIVCIIGLVSGEIGYYACILGYLAGDYAGKFAGWHGDPQ